MLQTDEKKEKIDDQIVSIKVYRDALGRIKDRQYAVFKATKHEPNQPEVIGEALRIADSVGWKVGGQPVIKNVPPEYAKVVAGLIRFLSTDPKEFTEQKAATQLVVRHMLENYK